MFEKVRNGSAALRIEAETLLEEIEKLRRVVLRIEKMSE